MVELQSRSLYGAAAPEFNSTEFNQTGPSGIVNSTPLYKVPANKKRKLFRIVFTSETAGPV